MQQVEHDSGGKVRLGPGALYGTIKQLREANWIEELPPEHDRRRYYRLTKQGRDQLAADVEYFRTTVKLAEQRKLINQPEPIIWAA